MVHMPESPNRRTFLQGAGLLAAATTVSGVALPSSAEAATNPDNDDVRFTLAFIPDTQYLFDQDRGDPAPLRATLRYLADNRARHNLAFTAHLGDIVENAAADELRQAGEVFEILDARRVPYSVLAGNHDIDSRTTDQRGPSPYLEVFGPQRFRRMPTFGGATADGYNSYHVFRAGGRDWLLFALDWRPSDGTLAWAKGVLRAHPRMPAILTTHDFAFADDDGAATLSEHGRRLWDYLVKDSDQIFLCVNGHFWPPGGTVLRNSAGRDVHVHITNYQDRYYGGGAMLRLYHFDLARDTIDVETFSPWILAQPAAQRNLLERQEIELTEAVDRFAVELDFKQRFHGFAGVPARPARPAGRMLVPGTLAYWRFDQDSALPVRDLSGNGNDLERVLLGDSAPDTLKWTDEHHEDQPGHASLRFDGGKRPARGAYLRTVSGSPLDSATFVNGYTIEAFVKLPADVRQTDHAWMSILCRGGTGADAHKSAGDPAEPLATLSLSDGMALQWAMFPHARDAMSTNWGHEMRAGEWFHVAVVNDGSTTTLYVDGSELLRNPSTPAVGIASAGRAWFVGAYHYDNVVEQGFYGWIGDIRIVGRALPVDRFMRA